ncbi:amino acid ABC transporter permease [Siculibacillus lacustris]|uniref:Amino acid ABC transporter permease n=1 Tax=Siculibacillus lacustris TaxID=1549641 RepID=A0A4V2KU08_9HYPH|nr:amino acid ABC transporter permease [Siculibacillus lacustris]TBW39497.1 amino acid ABC transporter permease [Siculibacillus lacustris]
MTDLATVLPRPLAPPPAVRPKLWVGLFGSKLNTAITLGFAALIWWVGIPFLRWAVIDATWTGTAETCAAGHGACWAFVVEKAPLLAFGLYPPDERPRALAALLLMVGLIVASTRPRFWRRGLVVAWVAVLATVVALLAGVGPLAAVSSERWGGLPITFFLAMTAFAGAFPLAIGLALARRSKMGGIRLLAGAFVETVRGVPLITLLYASTLLVPLMLPAGVAIDKFARATAMLVLFTAAYLAEIVRAGLAAVPAGQSEAARALGLSPWQTTRLVVLPQALKVSIPSMVTLAIGILLDTTLVVIIGMYELLNAARTAANDPAWLGFFDEAYAVAALVYFVLGFAGSRWSLTLERRFARGR